MSEEIVVELGNPKEPSARELLEASHALMQSLFPADSCHFLSVDELCVPTVQFFVARRSGVALGCGALKQKTGYGEVKSMFTTQNSRGKGVADNILLHIIGAAQALELPSLMLETGDNLEAAHRLYARHGFEFRGPFGDYVEHPNSLFMEKPL